MSAPFVRCHAVHRSIGLEQVVTGVADDVHNDTVTTRIARYRIVVHTGLGNDGPSKRQGLTRTDVKVPGGDTTRMNRQVQAIYRIVTHAGLEAVVIGTRGIEQTVVPRERSVHLADSGVFLEIIGQVFR